jgi:nucleotide-binding universal stress UspA family protein
MSISRESRPVVAGVDYSPTAALAVAYGAWEARRRGVGLHLVHGFESTEPGGLPPGAPYDDNELVVAAEQRLAGIGAQVRTDQSAEAGPAVATKVVAGSGGMTLVRESASAGLIVVGARGQGGFGDLLIGSVAAQVAKHASGPVLVVRPPRRAGDGVPATGCVLVGVDDSLSAEALSFAFDEAAARDVPLVAVHVWSVPAITARSVGTVWSLTPACAGEQLQATAEQVLAEALAGWTQKYPAVQVERRTVHGDEPARTLLTVADEVEADLIVVGTREPTGPGPVLGSVSQALVAHAPVSVAVVHRT